MKKNRRAYQPRIFDGRIIMSDEIERTHKEVLSSSAFEAVFDPMRELIEDLWPDRLYSPSHASYRLGLQLRLGRVRMSASTGA